MNNNDHKTNANSETKKTLANQTIRQEWEERQKEQLKRKILWRKSAPREKKTTNVSCVLIDVKRVVNVTKGGRRFRFFTVAAAGNHAGSVGIGSGKANEVALAREKAFTKATQNMIKIPFVNDTIAHPVTAKFCASRIMLKPSRKGSGLIVGGATRTVLELLGVKNIIGKSFASNNKMNVLRATMRALKKLRTPDQILEARGLKTQSVTEPTELKESNHARSTNEVN